MVLAACGARLAPPFSPSEPILPARDTCGAAPYAGLVGQPATALERVLILRPVQVVRPGRPAKAQILPQRLGFEVAGDGTVARLFCG